MKRLKGYLLLILVICIITACNKSNSRSTEVNKYTDRSLSIGVIGKTPEILEKKVKFATIKFSDLQITKFTSKYDAIFIIQDNMNENVISKYTNFCKESEVPFFFINIEHSNVDQTYAVGFTYASKSFKSWGYGLHNNIENEENINDVYLQIFKTISQNTTPKK